MSDNTELKPCPFCGGDASHNGGGNSVYGRLWWSVWCNTCEFEVRDREVWDPVNRGYRDASYPPKECFKTWNTRAAPKVKPLVWANIGRCVDWTPEDENTHLHSALALGRSYEVTKGKDGWYAKWQGKYHAEAMDSAEAAKAIAQDDYESRILSALEN